MDERKEEYYEQTQEYMQEFMEGLEEVNEKLEVLQGWRSAGRPLDAKNTRRSYRNAEALYRMATNIVGSTDQKLSEDERQLLKDTESYMVHMPDYVGVEFEASQEV